MLVLPLTSRQEAKYVAVQPKSHIHALVLALLMLMLPLTSRQEAEDVALALRRDAHLRVMWRWECSLCAIAMFAHIFEPVSVLVRLFTTLLMGDMAPSLKTRLTLFSPQ